MQLKKFWGTAIIRRRNELHMTQKDVQNLVGEENISIITLKRIEAGRPTVSNYFYETLSVALGLPPLLPDWDRIEEEIVERLMEEAQNTDYSVINIINMVNQRIQDKRLIWPSDGAFNAAALLLYLPLLDPLCVNDACYRLAGNLSDTEYAARQLRHLMNSIPESPAKYFVDYMLAHPGIVDWEDETLDEGYDAYWEVLLKSKERQ